MENRNIHLATFMREKNVVPKNVGLSIFWVKYHLPASPSVMFSNAEGFKVVKRRYVKLANVNF